MSFRIFVQKYSYSCEGLFYFFPSLFVSFTVLRKNCLATELNRVESNSKEQAERGEVNMNWFPQSLTAHLVGIVSNLCSIPHFRLSSG